MFRFGPPLFQKSTLLALRWAPLPFVIRNSITPLWPPRRRKSCAANIVFPNPPPFVIVVGRSGGARARNAVLQPEFCSQETKLPKKAGSAFVGWATISRVQLFTLICTELKRRNHGYKYSPAGRFHRLQRPALLARIFTCSYASSTSPFHPLMFSPSSSSFSLLCSKVAPTPTNPE